MAIFYTEGEVKTRPGVYQRYSNVGLSATPGAQDGICAIPIQANWGPLGVVVRNAYGELNTNYGSGEYGAGYTVPAAQAMFDGGATTVYTYRMGSGGKKASLKLAAQKGDAVNAVAKYPGTQPLCLAVQPKIGDASQKEVLVYLGTAAVETFSFSADAQNEPRHLVEACAGSKYIDFALVGDGTGTLTAVAEASGALTGGENPTVTNEDYSKAFEAFEPFYYNCIALDVNDDDTLSKTLLLQSYLDNAHKFGKLGIAVVGETASVPFEDRLKHARMLNDEKIVYLGSGWKTLAGDLDGVMAICRTAGIIASTAASRSIVHSVIKGAINVLETFSYAQYVDAINNGMLLPSMSNDGDIWYDSGVNTLVKPSVDQDDGWKKIRRTKTRFEMFDRLDRALLPKVGRVNCDSDGVGDVVQTGSRVLEAMIAENKLAAGATFTVERYAADSAWFVIAADDNDSLEKIYLHYQFRFAQEA